VFVYRTLHGGKQRERGREKERGREIGEATPGHTGRERERERVWNLEECRKCVRLRERERVRDTRPGGRHQTHPPTRSQNTHKYTCVRVYTRVDTHRHTHTHTHTHTQVYTALEQRFGGLLSKHKENTDERVDEVTQR
jgi:hypothetical protein